MHAKHEDRERKELPAVHTYSQRIRPNVQQSPGEMNVSRQGQTDLLEENSPGRPPPQDKASEQSRYSETTCNDLADGTTSRFLPRFDN